MKTVLIADDEESLRTLIETTLEAPGLRVLHAANGDQAVELARREHPDLILLDWMMPGKTGIEVAEALRSEPATADIAILMLTGRNQEKDRQRGLALGIRAYLVMSATLERTSAISSSGGQGFWRKVTSKPQ